MSIDDVSRSLSVARVRGDVEAITTGIPSRLAGSENGRRMAEYSAAGLRAAGVDAVVHDVPALVSFPGRAGLLVVSPGGHEIQANTLGHSEPTGPGGLEGELMDVGSGGFADYRGRAAAGLITLSELSYHPARHEKQRIAALQGAAGCIMMNWGGPGNTAVPFGSVKPVWGNPTQATPPSELATLPCIGIARTDGLKLREMMQAGPVRVRMEAAVCNEWRPVQVTTGDMCREAGQDFVLVGGHQDSWPGPQATDNAAGNACMLELSRAFAPYRDRLRRGLVFGFWTAHETGTMAGSSWFADTQWDRLRDHAVAYLQIDQPSCIGTHGWSTASNAELRGFHGAIEKRLLPGRATAWHRAEKNGDSSFFGMGIPMMAGQGAFTAAELAASANATLGWWHHSAENTIDKLDWSYMDAHLRVYAAWLWALCTATVLPYAFTDVARQFEDRLQELAGAGGGVGVDGALAAAAALRVAAERLDAEATAWRQRYAAGERDETAAGVLNDTFKRLSRILVPLASTAKGTYGHDPYGLTAQTSMVPALFDIPLLEGMPEGEARWMLQTQLLRERNRVTDGLREARRLIEASLHTLR